MNQSSINPSTKLSHRLIHDGVFEMTLQAILLIIVHNKKFFTEGYPIVSLISSIAQDYTNVVCNWSVP